jgi:signal transduction histidine kinase
MLTQLPPQRLEQIVNTLDRSLSRLGKLIDNLLDVARINAGKIELHPESLDIGEVVHEICARFSMEARNAGSDLAVRVPAPIHGVLDRTRLEQVLSNLVVNAIKYGNGKPIEVSAAELAGSLVIRVKDEGIGIDNADFGRIFDRFEQVGKNSGAGGLGLGLYITKQIVDAQGGKIRVKSEPGAGSTFSVELPLKK